MAGIRAIRTAARHMSTAFRMMRLIRANIEIDVENAATAEKLMNTVF